MNNRMAEYLVLLLGAAVSAGTFSGCATTGSGSDLNKLTQRQLNRMAIFQNGQECSFIVTDAPGEMYLTVRVGEEQFVEYSPKADILFVFGDDHDELKNVAFIKVHVVKQPEPTINIPTRDCYQLNAAMFHLLVEKYDAFHLGKEELLSEPESPPPTTPTPTMVTPSQRTTRV